MLFCLQAETVWIVCATASYGRSEGLQDGTQGLGAGLHCCEIVMLGPLYYFQVLVIMSMQLLLHI